MASSENLTTTVLDPSAFLKYYQDAYDECNAKNVQPETKTAVKPKRTESFNNPPRVHHKEDLLIQYCRGGFGTPCREFSTIIMNYDQVLKPWMCASHDKTGLPENLSSIQADSIKEETSTDKERFTCSSGKSPGFSQRNIIDYDLCLEASSEYSNSGDSASENDRNLSSGHLPGSSLSSEKSPQEAGQGILMHDIALSQATLGLLNCQPVSNQNILKSPIYIYSIKPPLIPGQETRHYYKVGRQLNIKHDNMDRLKKCPMMQIIQTRKYRANFGQLKRSSPLPADLFMSLLRSELVRSNFPIMSQDESHCIMCNGSHNEWFYVLESTSRQLEKIHSLPSNNLHIGWPYLNALVNKLSTLIE